MMTPDFLMLDLMMLVLFYVFDMQYQQNFTASQPIKFDIKVNGFVLNDINGYALVLNNKLISISSDGQRHFDLSEVLYKVFKTLSFSFIGDSVVLSEDSYYLSGKISII